jgi:hypothetical protein
VSSTFVPPGGEKYKVQDLETWGSVAAKHGMDAWGLIRFNYPNLPVDLQAASREVNWYLQEYVKCTLLTPDHQNYRFSSNAGFIFVPAAPKPPAPPPAPTVSFLRSNIIVPFMHKEMIVNAASPDVQELQTLNSGPDKWTSVLIGSQGGDPGATALGMHVAALMKWRNLVRSGAKWDHKNLIRNMLSLKKGDFHFPILGDPDHEYYYDIWSNIHYGFVGTAAGFSEWELQKGAAMGGAAGTNDDIDVETVQIGIDLWNRYGLKLTMDQLRLEILSRRDKMLKLQNTPAYIAAQTTGGDPNFKHITGIQDGQ